jgi:hypothetical protein
MEVYYSGLFRTLILSLNIFYSCLKIKNKSETMSSRKCGSSTASENMAKRPREYISLEGRMEVLEDWRVDIHVLVFVGI